MTKITITQWSVHNHSFNVLFSIRITTIEEPKLFPVRLHNRWYIRCKWLWDICGDWGTGPWKSCPHLLQIGVQSLAIGDHQNSKYFSDNSSGSLQTGRENVLSLTVSRGDLRRYSWGYLKLVTLRPIVKA